MQQVVVAERRLDAGRVAVLTLVPVDGEGLLPFTAGAHIELELGSDLRRAYSLASDPADGSRYMIAVQREAASRGGSAAVHDSLHPGQCLTIGAPRNLFELREDADFTLLIAGGIGVTPLLAMAYRLWALGRAFRFIYCARSREAMALRAELEAAPFAAHVVYRASDEQRFDAALDLPAVDVGTEIYCCGPAGFMQTRREEALAAGYADRQFHQELFGAEVDASGGGFVVELARSGRSVEVPEGKSIVQALAAVGVRVETMCGEGICGTCLCDVLEGEPDHRDSYLTDEERAGNRQMLLCCSRSKSPRLRLDL